MIIAVSVYAVHVIKKSGNWSHALYFCYKNNCEITNLNWQYVSYIQFITNSTYIFEKPPQGGLQSLPLGDGHFLRLKFANKTRANHVWKLE